VVAVTDYSGKILRGYQYDAFGNIPFSFATGQSGAAPTDDILFTGKDLDPDTGLYYFNARWFDSETGRYVSRTLVARFEEHPYLYCSSNPLNRVDTNGLWEKDVHHDDTRSLAIAVGIDSGTAEAIAARDQYFDENPDTCPSRHSPLHFPPNLSAIYLKALMAAKAQNVNAFGDALHQLQDYFAHVASGCMRKCCGVPYHPPKATSGCDDPKKFPKEYNAAITYTLLLLAEWKHFADEAAGVY